MKRVIMDSSSAILLYKCGCIPALMKYFSPVIPLSVKCELTLNGYEGSEFFTGLCREETIKVYEPDSDSYKKMNGKLHAGERDVIALYYEGKGDFILIDDGRGSAFCRDNKIPYINAVLAIKILFLKSLINEEAYADAWGWILANGRYSQKVIHWAENADEHDLGFFI